MSSVQIFRKLQQQPVINYTQRWCSKFNAITRGEQDSDCKVGEVTYLPDMTRPFEFCVPTTATKVPASPDWLHEVKYDGYRLRLERDGDRVRLITRGGYNWTKRFPWIAEAALKNRQKQFVIDGEAVVLGVDGVLDFNALHSRKHDDEVQLYAAIACCPRRAGRVMRAFDWKGLRSDRRDRKTSQRGP
jgi:ATP-dependent DNA ligase